MVSFARLRVATALLALGGCVQPATWSKAGATQSDYNAESYTCERDTRQSGYFGVGIYANANMQTFFNRCMMAHGYSTMFLLDHVDIKGNSRVATEKLMGVVRMQPGQRVDRDTIENDFNNIIAEYMRENVGGTIDPLMSYPRPGHINVTFEVIEAASAEKAKTIPLVIDHETFTGNVAVSTEKLTPALTLKPGDTVARDQVIADRNAIAAIYKGAKQGVKVTPNVTYPMPGHVDLNYELNEIPPKPNI